MTQENEEKIVVSIRLPKKLYKRFKITAEENDRTVTDVMTECMERYIKEAKTEEEEE